MGILGLAGKWQGRGHRRNTDPAVLAVEIGTVIITGAGSLRPVCLSFWLAHYLAPWVTSEPSHRKGAEMGAKWHH
jgi:hypothetical protein